MSSPFVEFIKKYDDGSSHVRVRGIIKVEKISEDPILDDIAVVSKDGSQKGYLAFLNGEHPFRNYDGKFVRFDAFTYSNNHLKIFVPILNKNLL